MTAGFSTGFENTTRRPHCTTLGAALPWRRALAVRLANTRATSSRDARRHRSSSAKSTRGHQPRSTKAGYWAARASSTAASTGTGSAGAFV